MKNTWKKDLKEKDGQEAPVLDGEKILKKGVDELNRTIYLVECPDGTQETRLYNQIDQWKLQEITAREDDSDKKSTTRKEAKKNEMLPV